MVTSLLSLTGALLLPLLLWLSWRCYAQWSPGQGTSAPGEQFQVFPAATPLVGSSGPVAAAATTATLAAAQNKTNFIEGFDLQGLGATGASNISVTITGLAGGTLTIGVSIPAGATVFLNPGSPAGLSYRFPTPMQASASNTAIVVNVPSFGSGNTFANVIAYGFQV